MVAYTATYTGSREVYIADLRGNAPSRRVTYLDSKYGALHVVQWIGDEEVVFSAYSMEAFMDETRLYRVRVAGKDGEIGKVTPIPLYQANDAAIISNDDEECTYFVRYKQSSNTIRYVGGTAENIWGWCAGDKTAFKVSGDYNGTSRSPRLMLSNVDEEKYLLFLSDRNNAGVNPKPVITNLFALQLGGDLLPLPEFERPLIKLTNVCDGIGIADFAVDKSNGAFWKSFYFTT